MNSVSLAYSPCPNDTFIFAAWTNGLLPDAPPVKVILDDVEALNEAAREGKHMLTKVSYGAIPFLTDKYQILRSGGALGRGCGPLLIARPDRSDAPKDLRALPARPKIAIPGKMTTAYALLRMALGRTPDIVEMRFDRIVESVAKGEVHAGLIIHESRFTYQRAGLIAYADLGHWWESLTGKPIPLGAILVRRDVDPKTAHAYNATIAASLRFAHEHDSRVIEYIRAHATEMDEDVMRAHIATYVNEFSEDVGEEGIAAVNEFFKRAAQADLIPSGVTPEFV